MKKTTYLYHFYAVIEDVNIGRVEMSGILPLFEMVSTKNYTLVQNFIWEQMQDTPEWATRDKLALRSLVYLHEEPT